MRRQVSKGWAYNPDAACDRCQKRHREGETHPAWQLGILIGRPIEDTDSKLFVQSYRFIQHCDGGLEESSTMVRCGVHRGCAASFMNQVDARALRRLTLMSEIQSNLSHTVF